jgi:hypothetical protein
MPSWAKAYHLIPTKPLSTTSPSSARKSSKQNHRLPSHPTSRQLLQPRNRQRVPCSPHHPRPCSPAPAQAGSEREEVVRLACINIRGSTNAATDIQCLIRNANAPDILILTETKRKKPQSMCKDISSRYTVHNSNTPAGNGVLTMLLDRKYSRVGAAAQQAVPAECKGYLIHMTAQSWVCHTQQHFTFWEYTCRAVRCMRI